MVSLCFQVIASVLRNLSWRADVNSKKTLREVGSVRALMGCALEVQKVRMRSDGATLHFECTLIELLFAFRSPH